MKVTPDYTFDDAPAPHVVAGAQSGSPKLHPWLRKVAPGADVIMSVCTGAFQVAQAGLFDGKRAKTHHPSVLRRSASWQALGPLSPIDQDAAESIAMDLLVTASAGPRIQARPQWLVDVLDRVRDEFQAPPSTTELAARAGVHPVYLARMVRQATGMSVAGIVRHRRVEQAARLLLGDTPLSSIALRCGFVDQPHFTRSFRSITGLTPGELRKLIRAR